jgi:glycosyltransferase involved in cell wall biosynthesis
VPLRIGINALYLIPGGVGGTEIYARNLISSLAVAGPQHEFFVVTNRETVDLVPREPNVYPLQQAVPGRIRPARIWWEQVVLPLVAGRHGLDVLLNPGFTAPLLCPCPQVTVFHDLQHKRHPEHFRWFDLPFWNMLLYGSAHRSTRLIAVSEATREDLLSYYGLDAAVVPHGVEPAVFEIADGRAPEPFLLCVSTLHPHKGIDTLLGAFARFRLENPEFRLVLAGMRGFAAEAIDARIGELRLSDHVETTGWISRPQLFDLYRRARALVYPSRFEGFGMPVSEAMAAGLPVVCSDIEPLRSVAAGSALLFTAGDEDALVAALARISNDDALRMQLAAQGRRQAARFTWISAALKTLDVLESAVSDARRR